MINIFITAIQLYLISVITFQPVLSLNNGLALTPPMGWMSWERYRCNTDCTIYPDECISENLFRHVADLMVYEGYKDLGYEYIIIDDCWLDRSRDESGKLRADPKRFSNGIKDLSDYIHSKGLKFGIYEDYGNYTCAGYPGTLGYLKEDACTFAEWGVDYVKLDGCYSDVDTMDNGYPEFGYYLNITGRPIVYSCSWPVYQEEEGYSPNYTAIAESCNLWRNYNDIDDSYTSVVEIINYFAKKQDIYAPNAGPGHWNDPDMLIIGNFGLSYEQSKLQMAIWAILAAPLIMSVDLGDIRPEFKAILQNTDIIAVNQDPLGIQGRRIYGKNNIEIWTRPITPMDGTYYSYAIAFVSYRTDGAPYAFSVTLEAVGLYHPSGYIVKDLFDSSTPSFHVSGTNSTLNIRVNPTGVVFLRADVFTNEKNYNKCKN